MDCCNSQKQLDSSQRKVTLCQYAEFRCKTIPIYFVLLYILTTHQLNMYHCIFCIIGCFLINTDHKKSIYNTDISDQLDLDLYCIYIKRSQANLLYV